MKTNNRNNEIKIILDRIVNKDCRKRWVNYKVVFDQFRNGGHSVKRFTKLRKEDKHGNVVYRGNPTLAGIQTISETTAKTIINRMIEFGFIICENGSDHGVLNIPLIRENMEPGHENLFDFI